MPIDKAEHAVNEAPRALDAFFAPLQIFFRGSGKQGVEASGVRAVFFGHFHGAYDVAPGLGHGHAALLHHALREEAGDRFDVVYKANFAHDFAPEAGIEQVQDGVGDAADVLVDRKPVGNFRRIERSFVVVRVAVAVEVPRRINERVHGVGLAARGTTALRASGVHKIRSRGKRRSAFTGQLGIFRKHYGKILVRHRDDSVLGAVDDGDGSAPVTLAGDAPVSQAKNRFAPAKTFGLRVRGHV